MKRLIERALLIEAAERAKLTVSERSAIYREWEERGLIAALALAERLGHG